MARMIPDHLRSDIQSRAEQTLYLAFREQLSDSFVVFHQVPWQQRDLRNGAKDGEADFVVAHPDLGILIIEVKGGYISYDGTRDRWFSNQYEIHDPFRQARESKHSLLSFLKERPYWTNRWVTIGDAVAFPDVDVTQGILKPDAHRVCVIAKSDMNRLTQWVEAAFAHFAGSATKHSGPNQRGIDDLIQLLSPSLELRPLLSSLIEEDQKTFIRLTERQYLLLRFIDRERQAAISGCAGSGKTLLAVEKSRRLAQQGLQVLLTCYNVNLAEYLREVLADTPNITVQHFHGLCHDLAKQVGIWPRGSHDQVFFDHTAPNLLIEAASVLNWRVDAVIVDEGQDVHEDWWLALRLLLHDPDHGLLYVFYDDNQNLYRPGQQIPLTSNPYPLIENCRNTEQIHRFVNHFYRGNDKPRAIGPVGRPIEILRYRDRNGLRTHLRKVIHQLTTVEHIHPADIAILTPYASENSEVWSFAEIGNYVLSETPNGSGEILCTTIYQFKGLESPVVILVELDRKMEDSPNNILYVGASRAMSHLIIIADEHVEFDTTSLA